MKFLAALLLSAVLSFPACASPITDAHKTTLHIGQSVVDGHPALCSATVIGPQAILTASHCEMPSDVLEIEGHDGENNNDIDIVGRIRDGNDHTIYLLKNVHFAQSASVNTADPLDAGEDVFVFGNPGDFSDILRKGYVAGLEQDQSLAAAFGHGTPDHVLFDLNIWHGDSGSGVFNDKGEVIAVISGIIVQSEEHDGSSIKLTYALRLKFLPADLARAKTFSAPNDPPTPEDK